MIQQHEMDFRNDSTRRHAILGKLMARSIVVDRGWITPCYEWQGPTSGNGRGGLYGRVSLDGATVATHILSWTNEHGLIPPRKQLDHLCNNRRCWREDHLELVTHKVNQKRRSHRSKVAIAAERANAARRAQPRVDALGSAEVWR